MRNQGVVHVCGACSFGNGTTIINLPPNASLVRSLCCIGGNWGTMAAGPSPTQEPFKPRSLVMLKFLASTVGIIFLIGLAVVIGLLMLIF